jgi:hypothetical protein
MSVIRGVALRGETLEGGDEDWGVGGDLDDVSIAGKTGGGVFFTRGTSGKFFVVVGEIFAGIAGAVVDGASVWLLFAIFSTGNGDPDTTISGTPTAV